jgi:hypothetical protein
MILCCISFSSFSQKISKKYYSYPDRILEIQISDTIILWRNTIVVNNVVEKSDTLHCTKKGDTLFIKEKTTYDNKNQVIIRKGKYLDYIRYDKKESLSENSCGILFKRNNVFFKSKRKQIIKTTNRETYNRILELHSRLKRLEIFGKDCDAPLPPLYYEDF